MPRTVGSPSSSTASGNASAPTSPSEARISDDQTSDRATASPAIAAASRARRAAARVVERGRGEQRRVAAGDARTGSGHGRVEAAVASVHEDAGGEDDGGCQGTEGHALHRADPAAVRRKDEEEDDAEEGDDAARDREPARAEEVGGVELRQLEARLRCSGRRRAPGKGGTVGGGGTGVSGGTEGGGGANGGGGTSRRRRGLGGGSRSAARERDGALELGELALSRRRSASNRSSRSCSSTHVVILACLVLARHELDVQVALERVGDPEQRVDPGRAAAALEPRDGRLRRVDQLRELALREAESGAPLGHGLGDGGEEPALLGAGEPRAESLER